MDAQSRQLRKKITFRFVSGIIVISTILLLLAGSFLYWQGCIYLVVIFVPLFLRFPIS
jgi:hypothetical protein